MKKLWLLLVWVFLAAAVYAGSHYCQYDRCTLYLTGQTKVESGQLAYQYKCTCDFRHVYWMVVVGPNNDGGRWLHERR